MSSFAALMALSATQTRQSEAQVQSALAERQRKETLKRKQQEEKDRKEKEMEAKIRLKILEEQKREQERQKKAEAERLAKEAALRKKEEEQRDALRYGPKKAKADYPSSSYARDDMRRRKTSSSDDELVGGAALTREEKRQLRLQRELNYGFGGHKRSSTGSYRKAGRRLPGGAMDVSAGDGSPSGSFRSVKDRLTHEPPGLIKLNVNKRDTRTIDEIRQDLERKKTKILSGEDAKGFDDWFGSGKSRLKNISQSQPSRASSIFSSRSPSPVDDKPIPTRIQSRSTKSLSRTPPVTSRPSTSSATISTPSIKAITTAKGTGISVKSMNNATDKTFSNAVGKFNKAPSKSAPLKVQGNTRTSGAAGKSNAFPSASAPPRKRPRSRSLSGSPPPAKRRSGSALPDNLSSEIWKIFSRGKDRHSIMSRPVDSDDDMEADALDLEHEELYRSVLSGQLCCTKPALIILFT